jgi:small basic protein (TIGR04137 family)
MSIHPSLRGANSLVGRRSVLSRTERLQKLMHDGKLSEEDSPYGLPKVRTAYRVKTKKVAKTEDGEVPADGEGAEAASASDGDK